MRGRSWWLMLAAGAMFFAPACSGGGDDSLSADRDTASSASDVSSGVATAPTGGTDAAPEGQTVAAVARELVSTAELTVVAKDVGKASAAAEAAATEHGGFVFGQQDSATGGDRATLTLKVPPQGFRDLLAALGDLGKVEQRKVATDDVTAAGADLDARIVSAQKSVDRVRGFLDETTNVGELSTIEGELTRRETELEQLVGQRRVLNDQVALATVTLNVTATPAPAPPAGDSLRDVPGFGGALASGVGALVKVWRVAGAGLGYALPFALIVGGPLLVVRGVRRRRRVVAPPMTA